MTHRASVSLDRSLLLVKSIFTRQRLKIIAFEIAVTLALVFISLRVFLETPGFYVYADQFWSIDPNLPNSQSFVLLTFNSGRLAPAYLFQFTRDFISWPSIVISNLSPNYQATIKSFVFYSFVLFVAGSWLLGEFVVRAWEKRSSTHLRTDKRELAKLVVVIAASSNFLALQLNSDGGTLADGLILLILAMETVIMLDWEGRKQIAAVGGLLSISLLLDPDYYLMSVLALLTLTLFVGRSWGELRPRLGGLGWSLAVSLPVLVFVMVGLEITATPHGYPAYRPLSNAAYLSQNLNPSSAVLLFGYGWPTLTLGPPSILLHSNTIGTLPQIGHPANVLIPNGLLTIVWLSSAAILPLLAFGSLLFKRLRRVSLPVLATCLFGLILTQYPSIPPLYSLFASAASFPLVGYAISTSVAVPDHFLMVVAAMYLVSAPLTVIELLSARGPAGSERARSETITWNLQKVNQPRIRGQHHTVLRYVTVTTIMALLVLSGWQAFNGSYFPARADNSTYTGNGVADIGAFSPFGVDKNTLEVYNYLFSNGTNFNVYWPVGFGVGLSGGTLDMPSVPLPGFSYLLSNNLSTDVDSFLIAHSVKYVVVQNISELPPQFFVPSSVYYQYGMNLYSYYFGLPNYFSVVSFLNRTPGLKESLELSDVAVFEVISESGLFYNANILLNFGQNELEEPSVSYGVFDSLGDAVALSGTPGAGWTAGIGTIGLPVDLLTPTNVTSLYLASGKLGVSRLPTTLSNLSEGVRYSANSTSLQNSTNWSQSSSLGQFNVNLDGFVFTNWAGNFSVSVSRGSVSIFSLKGCTFSINYGGPTTLQARGISVRPGVGAYSSTFEAGFTLSNPKNTQVGGTFVAMNQSSGVTYAFKTISPELDGSVGTLNDSEVVPEGTQNFTYRLGANLQGFLNISYYNVSVTISPLKSLTSTPFGGVVTLSNVSLPLPSEISLVEGYAQGTGLINGISFSSNDFVSFTVSAQGSLRINGTLQVALLVAAIAPSLKALTGFYVAYNGAFSNAILLEYNNSQIAPIETDYGMNLYVLPGPGQFHLVSPLLTVLAWGYIGVLTYLIALFIFFVTPLGPRVRSAVRRVLCSTHHR